jgi:heme exporter protein C
MFGAIILAVLMSVFPNIAGKKPVWWKLTAIFLVAAALILTLYPPVAGSLSSASALKDGRSDYMNLLVTINRTQPVKDPATGYWIKFLGNEVTDITTINKLPFNQKLLIKRENIPSEFKADNKLVIKAIYNKQFDAIEYVETVFTNPALVYPFIRQFEERMKILNLHVPMAWIAVIAYLMSMIYAIKYLRTKDLIWDIYTVSTASLGTFFAILATITGMFWAKYNWGTYWNWDPRQTSIFVLIMIYAAFFALRSAIDNEERRARQSSVYAIISFFTVPFLVFVLPRLSSGLHPGALGDGNSGPVISTQPNLLNSLLVYGFGLCLLSFTLIYFWMLNILVRIKKLHFKLN